MDKNIGNSPPPPVSTIQNTSSQTKSLFGSFIGRFIKGSPDAEREIPTAPSPVKEKLTKFSILRELSRVQAMIKEQQLVYPVPVKETPLTPSGQQSSAAKTDSYHVSDQTLAELSGETGFRSIKEPRRLLFADTGPAPEDIRQTDSRSTCHLLSALASYAASPTGKKLLQQTVQKSGDGQACVRFTAKDINDQSVTVTTDRLVGEDDQDIFSFGNKSQALWPGTVEKAFLGMRSQLRESIQRKIKDLEGQDKPWDAGKLFAIRDKYTSSTGKTAADHAELFSAIQFLPPFPKCTSQKGFRQSNDSPVTFSSEDLKNSLQLDLLKKNVEMGVPVVLGTRGDFKGSLNALITGTPKDHAVAVLGPAEIRTENGSTIPGVIIHDPYGESLSGDRSRTGVRVNSVDEGLPDSLQGSLSSLTAENDELLAGYEIVPSQLANETTKDEGLSDSLQGSLSSLTAENDELLAGYEIVPSQPETTKDEGFSDFVEVTEDDAQMPEDFAAPTLLKQSGSATRFYSYQDLHKYFRNAATARGGLNYAVSVK